ncbi:MAG: wax ester/triacylglycerol synthase family O-acyltransferase [Halioglobus sp.]
MRRVDLADAGFLLAEKRETPMHVGGINLFTLPDGVDEHEFMNYLGDVLSNAQDFRKPFGEYLVTRPSGMFWETDQNIDMEYHVRHSALPKPGRYRELFALASRLHGTLLDRNRPLWELHLIEGLQNRQFAVYNKIHHAAIDGVGAMHITEGMCSRDPDERIEYSPYSLEAYNTYKEARYGGIPRPVRQPKERELKAVAEALKQQYDSTANILGAMRRFGGAFFGRSGNLAVPWHNVPKTSINTRVSGARRFVAQSWDFARVKAVCKALDGTFNDIVLAMCSGALIRYLRSRDELPRDSLKAMAPVSLRSEGDLESANAVGFITADLATNIGDPETRLRTIQRSMSAGKELIASLSSREANIFMQLTQMPAILTNVLGLADKYPAVSTVISNVPGPRETLYWNGARLDGIYPASIVFDGFSMNITLVTYADKIDFGIIACRRSLPQIQRFIDYLEDALQELEEVAGLRAKTRQKVGAPKRKTPAKAKAKGAAVAKAKSPAKSSKKPKAAVKKKTKPKAKVKAAAAKPAKSKAKPKAKAKAKPKAKPKTKATAKPKLKARVSPKVKPKVKPKTKPKARS